MKSLADLQKLRDQAKKKLDLRESETDYRVVVGMATCGIAAGARPVLNALVDEVAAKHYSCMVTQTGCIGMCIIPVWLHRRAVSGCVPWSRSLRFIIKMERKRLMF